MATDIELSTSMVSTGVIDVSANGVRNVFCAPQACIIKGISIINGTDKAKHATDYGTYPVKNIGAAGAGTTVVATATTNNTGGTAIAKDTQYVLTLSSTAANLKLAAGDILQLQATEAAAGAGDLDAEAVVVVKYVVV